MRTKFVLAALVLAASHASANQAGAVSLSSVLCTEYSVSLDFSAPVTDGSDVTLISVGTSINGDFKPFSTTSDLVAEDNDTYTIVLSENDRINLGDITAGDSCTVQVDAGFSAAITATIKRVE